MRERVIFSGKAAYGVVGFLYRQVIWGFSRVFFVFFTPSSQGREAESNPLGVDGGLHRWDVAIQRGCVSRMINTDNSFTLVLEIGWFFFRFDEM